MNASSQSGSGKRPILDAFDAASGISDVGFATFGAGIFGVRRTQKIRSFATQQSSSLFSFGFFRCNRSRARFSDFVFGFFGSYISSGVSQYVSMTIFEVFFSCKALKIFNSIIGFIAVYMVDLFGRVKIIHPTFCHNTMKKMLVSQRNVSIRSLIQCVWDKLSKNFSAARYGVKMVKESVFDSVYFYAGHGVPFGAVTGNQVLT